MGWIIGAILGAVVKGASNMIASNNEYKKQVEDAEYQKELLERERKRQLEKADMDFNVAKDDANKKADKQDRMTTLSEMFTADDFNNQMDAIALEQEGEALQWNNQAMAAGQSEGDALSSMAASGTRSSSMAQAVDLQAAVNAANLQQEENQQRNATDIKLTSLFNNLNQGVVNIQENRTDALDLRKYYLEGGNGYNIWQLNRRLINEGKNDQIESINRDLTYARDHWGDRMASAFFGGFGSGFGTGARLGNTISNFGKL